MSDQGPPSIAAERWRELLEDAEATAAKYRERGWATLLVQPGDVTPLDGEPFGLDVLAPGDEVEALEALVEAATFDTSHVYRAEEGGVRFLIAAVEAPDDGAAVVVPAFLAIGDEATATLEARARAAGVVYTHVRPLSDDGRVTFTHDDPDLFF